MKEEFNFKNELLIGEEIIYEGKPNLSKGNKNIVKEILFIVFILIVQIFIIFSSQIGNNPEANTNELYFAIGIFGVFQILLIHGILYKVYLKNKIIKNNQYCVTNSRILKYIGNKKRLVSGNIKEYELITILNITKDNKFGDLQIAKNWAENIPNNKKEQVNSLKTYISTDHTQDQLGFIFESIENPREVEKIIKSLINN